MKNLTETQKKAFNIISREANSLVRENAKGYEYVRIYLYIDAFDELLRNGNTDLEVCGAHFFSGSNYRDIDESNQYEVYAFQQASKPNEDWLHSDYLQDIIDENIINQIKCFKLNFSSSFLSNSVALNDAQPAHNIIASTTEIYDFYPENNADAWCDILVVEGRYYAVFGDDNLGSTGGTFFGVEIKPTEGMIENYEYFKQFK